MSDKGKQKGIGVLMVVISIISAIVARGAGYENWFLLLGGIIPGIYAIFTRQMIFVF